MDCLEVMRHAFPFDRVVSTELVQYPMWNIFYFRFKGFIGMVMLWSHLKSLSRLFFQKSLSAPKVLFEAHGGDPDWRTSIVRLGHLAVPNVHGNMVNGTRVALVARIEDEICRLQVVLGNPGAMSSEISLGIRIARNSDAVSMVDGMRESGAIKCKPGHATPQVWATKKHLCGFDQVFLSRVGNCIVRVIDGHVARGQVR